MMEAFGWFVNIGLLVLFVVSMKLAIDSYGDYYDDEDRRP